VKLGITQALREGGSSTPSRWMKTSLSVATFQGRCRDAETREWVFGLFPILKERRHQLGGTLLEENSRCSLLAVPHGHPRLLLLDEPSLDLHRSSSK